MSLPLTSDSTTIPFHRGLVNRLDVELESSWREGRYGAFMRAWIAGIVLAGAAGFIVPLVFIGLYSLVAIVVLHSDGRGTPNFLAVCSWIGGLAAAISLLFTVPVIAMKSRKRAP